MAPDPRPSRLTPGELARGVAVGVVAGWGATLLIGLDDPDGLRVRHFIFGSLVGALVYLFSRGLYVLFAGVLDRLDGWRKTLILAGLFFTAGCAAFLLVDLGFQLALVGRARLPGVIARPVAVIGIVAIAVGLSIYSYEVVRERLRASVSRLKEAEFAEKELELARGLQKRLLPPAEVEGEGYRVAARNLPARVVAGDFYDVFRLADGALGVVVADVAGKGMAAALVMASVKAVLPLVAAERSAAGTLAALNAKLAAELSPREFVALAYVRFDPRTGAVRLANAGLPDPYLLRRGAAAEPVAVPGPRLPLGVRREVHYQEAGLTLAPGERLLLATDGLAEAPRADGEPLGYPALAELLAGRGGAPAEPAAWLDDLLARVEAATRAEREDDWTALVLERT